MSSSAANANAAAHPHPGQSRPTSSQHTQTDLLLVKDRRDATRSLFILTRTYPQICSVTVMRPPLIESSSTDAGTGIAASSAAAAASISTPVPSSHHALLCTFRNSLSSSSLIPRDLPSALRPSFPLRVATALRGTDKAELYSFELNEQAKTEKEKSRTGSKAGETRTEPNGGGETLDAPVKHVELIIYYKSTLLTRLPMLTHHAAAASSASSFNRRRSGSGSISATAAIDSYRLFHTTALHFFSRCHSACSELSRRVNDRRVMIERGKEKMEETIAKIENMVKQKQWLEEGVLARVHELVRTKDAELERLAKEKEALQLELKSIHTRKSIEELMGEQGGRGLDSGMSVSDIRALAQTVDDEEQERRMNRRKYGDSDSDSESQHSLTSEQSEEKKTEGAESKRPAARGKAGTRAKRGAAASSTGTAAGRKRKKTEADAAVDDERDAESITTAPVKRKRGASASASSATGTKSSASKRATSTSTSSTRSRTRTRAPTKKATTTRRRKIVKQEEDDETSESDDSDGENATPPSSRPRRTRRTRVRSPIIDDEFEHDDGAMDEHDDGDDGDWKQGSSEEEEKRRARRGGGTGKTVKERKHDDDGAAAAIEAVAAYEATSAAGSVDKPVSASPAASSAHADASHSDSDSSSLSYAFAPRSIRRSTQRPASPPPRILPKRSLAEILRAGATGHADSVDRSASEEASQSESNSRSRTSPPDIHTPAHAPTMTTDAKQRPIRTRSDTQQTLAGERQKSDASRPTVVDDGGVVPMEMSSQ